MEPITKDSQKACCSMVRNPDGLDSFVGKHDHTSAEIYDEFPKALDVNFLLRKAATVSSPVMEV